MPDSIQFRLNAQPVTLATDPRRTLLWVLRTDLELAGTKFGCGIGACGSCTVVVDGETVRSCQVPLAYVAGKEVTTIEGLARGEVLHPLQEAFIEHGAFQCGFCTPGVLMSAYGLLRSNPSPSDDEIVGALEDNLCRCGAHSRIVEAVRAAARNGGGDHA
jgi:aerobic-type carbon monoxide dehydrogenase small subunit (CoxS/CutS family)